MKLETGWINQERQTFRKNLKLFLLFYLSAIVIGVITFYFFKHDAQGSQKAFDSISKNMNKTLHKESLGGSLGLQFLVLFANNSLVAFTMVGIGLLPLIVIPFLILSFQTGIVGATLSFGYHLGVDPMHVLLLGVVPHGAFELTAVVLASVLGTKLSWEKFNRLRKKQYLKVIGIDKDEMKVFRTYLRVVVPLLFVAAFVETYITPILLN